MPQPSLGIGLHVHGDAERPLTWCFPLLSQSDLRVSDFLGFMDLESFLQTFCDCLMTLICLSFSFSYCQPMPSFGGLLNHFSISRIMCLNQNLVLHELLLFDDNTLIVVYVHLIEHPCIRTHRHIHVPPTLPGSWRHHTTMRKASVLWHERDGARRECIANPLTSGSRRTGRR